MTLDHPPEKIIAQLLIDLAIGSDPDEDPLLPWPVYAPNEPDHPEDVLVVQGTTGRVFGRNNVTNDVDEHYGFQILLRTDDDDVGSQKMSLLADTLAKQVSRKGVVLGDATYCIHSINRSGTIIPMGRMPNRLAYKYTYNGLAYILQTS